MIRSLQRNETDVAVADFYYTLARSRVGDFSTPIMQADFTLKLKDLET